MLSRSHPGVGTREPRAPVPASRLWAGLLLAPTAWAVQGGLGWFVGERVCTSLSVSGARLIVAGIGLLAVAVAVSGGLTAWKNWQQSGADGSLEAWDRIVFMSICGLVVSASFVIGTAWAGLTPLLVTSCGGMR